MLPACSTKLLEDAGTLAPRTQRRQVQRARTYEVCTRERGRRQPRSRLGNPSNGVDVSLTSNRGPLPTSPANLANVEHATRNSLRKNCDVEAREEPSWLLCRFHLSTTHPPPHPTPAAQKRKKGQPHLNRRLQQRRRLEVSQFKVTLTARFREASEKFFNQPKTNNEKGQNEKRSARRSRNKSGHHNRKVRK